MRREEGHFDGRFANKIIPSKKMKNSWKFHQEETDEDCSVDDEQNHDLDEESDKEGERCQQ